MSFTINGNKVSGPVPTYTPEGTTTPVPYGSVSICGLSKASYKQTIQITFWNSQAPANPIVTLKSGGSTQSVATPMSSGTNGSYEQTWAKQVIPAGTTSIEIEFSSSSATDSVAMALPSTPVVYGTAISGTPATTLYAWNTEDSTTPGDQDELDSQVFLFFN